MGKTIVPSAHRVLVAALLLGAAGVGASAGGSLLFDPPSVAGTTGFPSDYQGLGRGPYVLGRNGDDGWRGSNLRC